MALQAGGDSNDAGWARVLGMAPSLAERARKLFRRRGGDSTPPPVAEAAAAIEVRVHAVEKRVADLGEEMAASFEVVSAITDQHSELVRAVDVLRARARRLERACAALAGGLVIALAALALLALAR